MAANLVTPKIDGPDKIYFDAQAGEADPTRYLGPNEGSAAPQEITLSFTQTISPPPANKTYKADGTLSRTNGNLELYRDKSLAESSKLDFCENTARIANKELAAGLKLYAKGVNVGFCTLKLELDLLETATRKATDFSSNTPETLINVDQVSTNGTLDTQLLAKEHVTPAIRLGTADTQVTATGTPVSANFSYASDAASSNYTGGGTVTMNPAGTDIKFYSNQACEPGQLVDLSSGYKISNSDLKSGAKTLYCRAASDTANGPVALILTLDAATDPTKVSVDAPAKTNLTLLPVNQVTPKITVSLDGSYDGKLWYPALTVTPRPSIAFSMDQSNSAIKFEGGGVVSRSGSNIDLFYDKALTTPLSFIDNKAVVPLEAITSKTPFYLKGTATGETTLSFELVNYCQPSVQTAKAASTKIQVAQVTRVVPNVDWTEPDVPQLSADEAGNGTVVKLFLSQLSDGGGAYTGAATLTRGHKDLAVYTSDKKPVFSGTNLSATLANDVVMNTKNQVTAQWQADRLPEDPSCLTLTLTPSPSDKPYVVTDPGSQFLASQEAQNPPLTVAPKNTVTPVIQTAYDLVMKSTSLVDGAPATFTAPTPAHIYLTQEDTAVGYDGGGTLTRSNGNIRLFTDAACTQEVPFVGNQAVLPNAALKDAKKIYYLQGAAAGACSLTLALAKAPDEKRIRPNFRVADPVVKQLAVIALQLDIYRDDGTQSPITSVAMTDRAKRQTGRFLPLQNPSNQFGRAKVVIKAVQTGDWPAGANKHVVTLNISSDKLLAWSATKDGTQKASSAAPLQLSKSDLSSDRDYWLQSTGDSPSSAARDIVVSLGMDRTDKDSADYPGKPDSITPLGYGDWAATTIVKIARTTPDADAWEQYTNQPIDYGITENTNQKEAKDGQHMLVTATTDPAIKGVGVDFMLWANAANGTDIPATTASMDLKTHLADCTDSSGKASRRLKVSRYGGDKFTAVGFLADDAATGAATFGAKATDAPATYRTKEITVWRKQKYNLTYMKRHASPPYDGNFLYLFDEGKLQGAFGGNTATDSFLKLELDQKKEVNNTPVLYEKATKSPTGSGTTDSAWTASMRSSKAIPDPADRTFTLVFVETLASSFVETTYNINKPAIVSNKCTLPINDTLFDLTGNTSYLKPGSAVIMDSAAGTGWTSAIADAKVTLQDTADANYELVVDLTGITPPSGKSLSDLFVKATLYVMDEYYGFSDVNPVVYTACRYAEQLGASASDEVYATAAHEIGHYLGLAPKTLPTKTGEGNKEWYLGNETSKTTQYYDRSKSPMTVTTYNKDFGQGPHCMTGYSDFTDLRTNHGLPAKVKCLMFDSGVTQPITVVCNTCKKSAKAREYALSTTSYNEGY